jgi:gliding motility-associated lipoprotein GldH
MNPKSQVPEIVKKEEESPIEMRVIKNSISSVLFVLMVVLMCSCESAVWYKSSVNVPVKGWHKDSVAVFKSSVSEIEKSCHILLTVENTKDYKYSNIWFFVDAVSPKGHMHRDTLECNLADDRGQWYGRRKGGHGYKSTHPYKLNIRFPEKGLYTYYVMQGMRDTVLAGIHSVGIEVVGSDH